MPLIDVMLPSRLRPALLERSVQSLKNLAADPGRIAVYVAADNDDPGTWSVGARVADRVLISPRHGYTGLHHYYNDLARVGTGKWLLLWNDDAVMTTTGWDNEFVFISSGVMVADLWSAHSPGLVTFPAVRRSAVEAVGEFCTGTPHCDTHWQDIGRETGTIKSIAVSVHHDRFDLTGNNDDSTWRDHAGNSLSSHEYSSPANQAIRAEAVRKIREMRP